MVSTLPSTGVRGQFRPLLPVLRGAVLAKVYSAREEPVPWRASVKPIAAFFRSPVAPALATEPDRSSTRATLTPAWQVAGRAGLFRDSCQVPSETVRVLLPEPVMKWFPER